MPNHVASTTARTLSEALLAAVVGLLAGAVGALSLGRLSDRIGRRPVVIASLGAIIISAVPMTLAAESGSLLAFGFAELVAGFAVGGALSVSMLAEMFPVHVRSTGLSLTGGLATALVGGTTPLIDQILFKATGFELAPALYAMAVAGLAIAALWSWPETAFDDLS
jgi:MHS family proline/betaine transporter-like MFS transporter